MYLSVSSTYIHTHIFPHIKPKPKAKAKAHTTSRVEADDATACVVRFGATFVDARAFDDDGVGDGVGDDDDDDAIDARVSVAGGDDATRREGFASIRTRGDARRREGRLERDGARVGARARERGGLARGMERRDRCEAVEPRERWEKGLEVAVGCLLYTSDAADE